MNTSTVKTSIIAVIIIALIVAVGFGIGATKSKAGTPAEKPANPATNETLAFPNLPLMGQPQATFKELQEMQNQMNRMFNQMSSELRNEPQFNGLPETPGYSLSLNVQDLKNHFLVQAYLPDTSVSNVNVKLKNDRTLQVTVNNQESQKSKTKTMAANISEWGQYEQSIQLPSPVKANEMKVTRHEHELLITLPKA